ACRPGSRSERRSSCARVDPSPRTPRRGARRRPCPARSAGRGAHGAGDSARAASGGGGPVRPLCHDLPLVAMKRYEVADRHKLPDELPAGRTEPGNTQELSPQIDFLYRAVDNFTQSVQFGDAKAGGVVLILSIGILDLLRNLRQFLDARDVSAGWGWLATV